MVLILDGGGGEVFPRYRGETMRSASRETTMRGAAAPECQRPDDEFLSQADALKWLGGIDRSTLWRWRRDGIGPVPVRLGPQKIGYQLGELRRFAAERREAMRHG